MADTDAKRDARAVVDALIKSHTVCGEVIIGPTTKDAFLERHPGEACAAEFDTAPKADGKPNILESISTAILNKADDDAMHAPKTWTTLMLEAAARTTKDTDLARLANTSKKEDVIMNSQELEKRYYKAADSLVQWTDRNPLLSINEPIPLRRGKEILCMSGEQTDIAIPTITNALACVKPATNTR